MSDTKRFHLGDLLSVSTGRLVSPRHMAGVHELMEHLAGHPVWTHQLIRLAGPAALAIVEQFPWLAEINKPTHITSDQDATAWLAPLIERYGEWHDVEPMPSGMYERRDPIEELAEVAPHVQVIAVVVPDEGEAP